MVSKTADKSSNTEAVVSPLDKDKWTSFLCREELSHLNGQPYMPTGMYINAFLDKECWQGIQ